MGWASGTNVAEAIEKIIIQYVDKDKRLEAGELALTALIEQDWDCVDEVDLFHLIQLKEDRKTQWADYDPDEEDIAYYEEEYQRLTKKLNT